MTVLALLLAIVPSVMYSMGLTFVLRDAVCAVLTPMQRVFNYATEAIDSFAAYFYKFDELVEDNIMLRERVAELEAQIYDAAELEERSAWMSNFLELKTAHTDFKLLSASVTGRDGGNYSKILNLDVGSSAGVALNMPVITSDGIVGRITELGLNWSRVTTIIEAQSSVGAYVERSGASGICEGSFELSSDGLCRLMYLPADGEVKEGDRILSTGLGSVYPRGLVVGYVERTELNPISRTLDVYVRCAADCLGLDKVMIITDFETYAE